MTISASEAGTACTLQSRTKPPVMVAMPGAVRSVKINPPTIATLVTAAALLGCGNSMLYPTLVALVVDRTPEAERGLAIGTLSGAWDVGVAVGSPLTALLIQSRGYSAGFLASATMTLLGLLTFIVTERRRRRLALRPQFGG